MRRSRVAEAKIGARSLITHGIKTAIVDIDPVVYKYARESLGLAAPCFTPSLTDACGWAHPVLASDKYRRSTATSSAAVSPAVGTQEPEKQTGKPAWITGIEDEPNSKFRQ